MKYFIRVGFGQDFSNNSKQNYAEGMGDRNDCSQKKAIPSPTSGTDHISGNEGFSMSWLKSMQRTKGNGSRIEHKKICHNTLWFFRG